MNKTPIHHPGLRPKSYFTPGAAFYLYDPFRGISECKLVRMDDWLIYYQLVSGAEANIPHTLRHDCPRAFWPDEVKYLQDFFATTQEELKAEEKPHSPADIHNDFVAEVKEGVDDATFVYFVLQPLTPQQTKKEQYAAEFIQHLLALELTPA